MDNPRKRWRIVCGRILGFAALIVLAVAVQARSGARAADSTLVARGKYLATAGDCQTCHTAPDGQPYAGGRAIPSPFGTIYSDNITPDPTGIGTWSDQQFYRALHDGIGKDGQHLYPAMPYPWLTRLTYPDAMAIKAYLSTLPPVHAPDKPDRLAFPFNLRFGMAGWNTLYFNPGTFKPDPQKSAQVNRGAYLVEGLGHCGACHTPHNLAQAPEKGAYLGGGSIQGWYAPNITSDMREGIGAWSDSDLVSYFKTGLAPGKAIVAGPMQEVVRNSLSRLTDADLDAIAAYLKSTPATTVYKAAQYSEFRGGVLGSRGAGIYETNCAFCHQPGGGGIKNEVPPLVRNGAVIAGGPEDVVRVVLAGLPARAGLAPMPAVGTHMTDQEIAEVTNYVRQAWGNKAPPTAAAGAVGNLRAQTHSMLAGNDCGKVDPSPIADALKDSSNGLTERIGAFTAADTIRDIDAIVARAKAAAPKATQADLVNGLTSAYCPIVASRGGNAADKATELGQFSVLVYSAIVNHGIH